MKKLVLSAIFLLMLALAAGTASADLIVSSTIDSSSPLFGGESQAASNLGLDEDDSDRDIYVDGTLTLTNNGTSDVTVADIAVTPASGFSLQDINISLTTDAVISKDTGGSVTLNARIPEKLDAVDSSSLLPTAFNVATVTLKDGSGNSLVTFDAYMQRENNLEIKKAYVKVNGDSDRVNDGDTVKDIRPGDLLEVELIVENRYSDSDDVEIENVEATVETDDSDVDVDDELDFGDMDADTEDTESTDFDVDEDADDKKYDLEIRLSGIDEFGAKHGEAMEVELDVERKSHELKINNIEVSPEEVSCGDNVILRVNVANIGKKNEDEVLIEVRNDDLNYLSRVRDIEIDNDEDVTKSFTIPIPEDAANGVYSFTVKTFYDFSKDSDYGSSTPITVNCEEEEEEEEIVVVTQPEETQNQEQTTQTAGTTSAETTEEGDLPTTTTVRTRPAGGSFRNSAAYILLLVLIIVVVVVAGAIIVVKALVK